MDILSYQRTVFGYHGCDRRLADNVLAGKVKLTASTNAYDWLGSGIYFWEHGPARAMEWARAQARRKASHIRNPAILGAVIQLGHCFDLLDTRFTRELAFVAAKLGDLLRLEEKTLPENEPAGKRDFDWLKRHRDCFVLEYAIPLIGATSGIVFQTVRGVFQEGEPAFAGAGIKLKSHIQITVRDPQCIIGYFRPESF
jgi:hypothetical protein